MPLRLGRDQHPLQGRQRLGAVALRLRRERLQDEDPVHSAEATGCLGRFL